MFQFIIPRVLTSNMAGASMDGGEGPDGCVGGESGTDACGTDDDLKVWSLTHFFLLFVAVGSLKPREMTTEDVLAQ